MNGNKKSGGALRLRGIMAEIGAPNTVADNTIELVCNLDDPLKQFVASDTGSALEKM